MRWLAGAAALAVMAAIIWGSGCGSVDGEVSEIESGQLPFNHDFLPTDEVEIADLLAEAELKYHYGTSGLDLDPPAEERRKPCYRYGVLGQCIDKQAILAELDEARYLIEVSQDMLVGRRYQARLTIKPNENSNQQGSESNIAEGTTKVSLRMEAEISGPHFTIEPKGRTERELSELNPTQWIWGVTPLEAGRLPLQVSLYVILTDDKGTKISEDKPLVADHTIVVTVRWIDQVVGLAKTIEPVRAAAVGLGTLAVAILGWFGLRRGKARRRNPPRQQKPPKPPS